MAGAGLFLLQLMLPTAAGSAGWFALALQAGRSLPAAASVSHHNHSENPSWGTVHLPLLPVHGGEWEEAQLPSRCEVLQMLMLEAFAHLLPLPTS